MELLSKFVKYVENIFSLYAMSFDLIIYGFYYIKLLNFYEQNVLNFMEVLDSIVE